VNRVPCHAICRNVPSIWKKMLWRYYQWNNRTLSTIVVPFA
jgi:hypothetical protein